MATEKHPLPRNWLAPQTYLSLKTWERFGTLMFNLLVYSLLVVYLFPIVYMVFTSVMEGAQLSDRYAPIYPARHQEYAYQGKNYKIYFVPFENGEVRKLALIKPSRYSSEFIDPQDPSAGLITWEGNWRILRGVYGFHIAWENFSLLLRSLRFPRMLQNTLLMALITEIGVMLSSVVVAYGFSRFPLPGGNLLFYLMIGTILIPEKVTLIPTYFFFVRVLEWKGTWLPLLVPFFFGNAVYIFLLRQNFMSIPKDLDEAAMLDGAGPLRILLSVVLPQSWPVIITVGIMHFFYIWNETRQASLYLSTRPDLVPVSFGVQNFQSLAPIQNLLQASALVIMVVPLLVLLVSQRYFMQNMVITGMER